ncbi:MAG TPA: hypothetical protein V6D02_09820 [Candidatus Obscuribacterales bacterium]
MPRKRHPELEGFLTQPLYTFELKSRRKTLRNRLLWTLLGVTLGAGLAGGAYWFEPLAMLRPAATEPTLAADDPFRVGSNQAMSAAELTQTAEYREEWSQVALLWQQAIRQMQAVPSTHPHYAVAQQKRVEYDRNLQYAQSNVNSRSPNHPQDPTYWTTGSDRELVIHLQGMPTRVNQYDTSCREVLYYGDSTIELINGYVSSYSDVNGNLKVLGDGRVALSVQPQPQTWTLGSSQDEVFQVQGTPTRTTNYQNLTTLHYQDSSVELREGRVVGYANLADNLKVALVPIASDSGIPTAWVLGAGRTAVLRAEQQTPTAVSRLDNSCEEVFTFDQSTVTFRKGFVSEYSNFSNNLQL